MDESESASGSVMSDSATPWGLQPTKFLYPWNSPGKNTGVGSHSFLQGIFPTQGSNLGLLYCGQILYCLSHQGSHEYMCIIRINYMKLLLTEVKIDIGNFILFNYIYIHIYTHTHTYIYIYILKIIIPCADSGSEDNS